MGRNRRCPTAVAAASVFILLAGSVIWGRVVAQVASSTFAVELAGFWVCRRHVPQVEDVRQSHPFVRPGDHALRPDLPFGTPPRAGPVKDGPWPPRQRRESVLDRPEHGGTLAAVRDGGRSWTPTTSWRWALA